MSAERDAFESIQKFTAQFQGLVKAGEVLGKWSSFEQAISEVQASLHARQAEHAAFLEKAAKDRDVLDKERAKLVERAERLRSDMANTTVAMNEHISARKSEGETILTRAKEDGERYITMAKADGKAIVEAAKAEADKVRASVSDLGKQIEERNGKLADLDTEHKALCAEHAALTKEIRSLKAKFS